MRVADLMHDDPVVAHVDDDQEEVSELFTRYGYLAIPVVDNECRLVGIVTVDDILEVIEEEATEDIERMGGVIDTTDKEYLDRSVWQHVKARILRTLIRIIRESRGRGVPPACRSSNGWWCPPGSR